MTDNTSTPFSKQCEILGDLWIAYKDDEDFEDFIDYNDLGLPLAYAISNEIVKSTPLAEGFITETWDIFVAGLGFEEDLGFEDLDSMLQASEDLE